MTIGIIPTFVKLYHSSPLAGKIAMVVSSVLLLAAGVLMLFT